jgi:RNA polymerase sigma-70 factor (ECF subfamily)
MSINNENGVSSRSQRCLHDASKQWTDDDCILVLAAKAGNTSAFSTLVEHHTATIYALAEKLLGDADEAEDATQETFIRAYNRLETFRGHSTFATWLYRIGINICRDHLRHRQTQEHYMEIRRSDRSWSDEYYGIDPERVVLAVEKRQTLSRVLGQLPINYRTTLLLHDVEGFTISKIATLMKVPLSTAKSRLRRARLTLVMLLNEQGLSKTVKESC